MSKYTVVIIEGALIFVLAVWLLGRGRTAYRQWSENRLYRQALERFDAGDLTQARNALTRYASDTDDDELLARERLAFIEYRIGDQEAARKAYEALVREEALLGPERLSEACNNLAVVAYDGLRRKNLNLASAEARQWLEKAVQANPKNGDALLNLAALDLERDDVKTARTRLAQVLGDGKFPVPALFSFGSLKLLMLLQAAVAAGGGDMKAADERVAMLKKLDAAYKIPMSGQTPEQFLDIARLMEVQRRDLPRKQRDAFLAKAAVLTPEILGANQGPLFHAAGVGCRWMNKPADAMAFFERAIPALKDNVVARHNLASTAVLLYREEQDAAKRVELGRSAAVRIEDFLALKDRVPPEQALVSSNNLGVIRYDLGDLAAATKSFEEAVAVAARQAPARRPLFLGNLGMALMEHGNFIEALKCLREAAQLDPKREEIQQQLQFFATKPSIDLLFPRLAVLTRKQFVIALHVHNPDSPIPIDYSLVKIVFDGRQLPFKRRGDLLYVDSGLVAEGGEKLLRVTAQDKIGNACTKDFRFTLDLSGPAIRPLAPADGDTAARKDARILFAVEDPSGVNLKTLEVLLTREGSAAQPLIRAGKHYADAKHVSIKRGDPVADPASVTAAYPAPEFPKGNYTVKATVEDMAGYPATLEWKFVVP